MSEESLGTLNAKRDFEKDFHGKDTEYAVKRYVEAANTVTLLVLKHDAGQPLTDQDYYDADYASEMMNLCSLLVMDSVVKSAGYTKDKNDLYIKKKRGLFR